MIKIGPDSNSKKNRKQRFARPLRGNNPDFCTDLLRAQTSKYMDSRRNQAFRTGFKIESKNSAIFICSVFAGGCSGVLVGMVLWA
jgi:hypothetical protein